MPDWARYVLAAFAVYRLAQFIAIDYGPFGVFDWLRRKGGAYDRNERGAIKTELGKFLACPYCSAVWLAAPVAALVIWPTLAGNLLLLWLGLSGVQAYLQGPRKP